MKAPRIMVVVADGASARLFRREAVNAPLMQVANGELSRDVKRSGEIDADRPGRTFDSAGQGRHAMEPHSDPARHAEEEFMREVVERMSSAARMDHFDRLIVVAPPRALGELRKLMNKQLQALVVREIAKDLTKLTPVELASHIDAALQE